MSVTCRMLMRHRRTHQAAGSNAYFTPNPPPKTMLFRQLRYSLLPQFSMIRLWAVELYAANLSSGLILGLGCCSACHKSHCVCIPSQTSGVVLSHAERRKAIPAVTPAFPFSTLESVTRDTCNAFAALVIVISSGIHSRNTSPGCAGLCILLILNIS